jgi:hypothetical protein
MTQENPTSGEEPRKNTLNLNSSVDHDENSEYVEKNDKLLNIMVSPDG